MDASYCRYVARERSVCILWPTIQQYLCRREFCRTCLPAVLLTVLSEFTSYERLISFRLTKTDLYVDSYTIITALELSYNDDTTTGALGTCVPVQSQSDPCRDPTKQTFIGGGVRMVEAIRGRHTRWSH